MIAKGGRGLGLGLGLGLSVINFYPSPSPSLSPSPLRSGSTAPAQDARLLDASADQILKRTVVPSEERKVGEVR
jgi:hypothetical protein